MFLETKVQDFLGEKAPQNKEKPIVWVWVVFGYFVLIGAMNMILSFLAGFQGLQSISSEYENLLWICLLIVFAMKCFKHAVGMSDFLRKF